MARKEREKSKSGIYHVMLRGINKQIIFIDRHDYLSFLNSLQYLLDHGDEGTVEKPLSIYAYVLMDNHIHLLVREGTLPLSKSMQILEDRFVAIYNSKHERVGHLFQGRFLSEPVDDPVYFLTLIRYIHMNPVKAGLVSRPEMYLYSSWGAYLNSDSDVQIGSDPFGTSLALMAGKICDVNPVIKRYGKVFLVDFVNQETDDFCMDIDNIGRAVNGEDAWRRLSRICGSASADEFKKLPVATQVIYLKKLIETGVSVSQASRLSSLSRKTLYFRLNPEKYAATLEHSRVRRLKTR